MSLEVECPHCRTGHSVNRRLAGREVRCRQCDRLILVPEIANSSDADREREDRWRDPTNESSDSFEAVPPAAAIVAAESPDDAIEAIPIVEAGQGSGPAVTASEVGAATRVNNGGTESSISSAPPVLPGGRWRDQGPKSAADSDDEPNFLDHPGAPDQAEADDDGIGADLRRRGRNVDAELDMTAMVDVTFLLLIFFMVTASFSLQKAMEVPRQTTDLPSSTSDNEPIDELDVIELEIGRRGSFLVISPDFEMETPGKQNLTNTLKRAIAERRDAVNLNIKVHESAPVQSLVDGWDAGTIAGFTDIKVTEVDGFD